MLIRVLALLLFAWATTAHAIDITQPPYNAMPDDGLDDAPAIQAAIDALPLTGGTVTMPPGLYWLDTPLVIQKPLQLLGAGPSTVLMHRKNLGLNGKSNAILIGDTTTLTSGVTLAHFTMQGPTFSALRTTMIRVGANSRAVSLHNLQFRHVSSSCILLAGLNIRQVTISDNRADEFYEQFVDMSGGGTASVRIERNYATSTRGHPTLGSTEPIGIVFEPRLPGTFLNILIVDNVVSFAGMALLERINTFGVTLSHRRTDAAYTYRQIVIEGNRFYGVGVGVRVQTLREGSVTGPGSVTIRDNRIEDVTAYGILASPAADATHRDTLTIQGNTIRGYSQQAHRRYDGIRVAGIAQSPVVRGNTILDPVTGTAATGRYALSLGVDVTVPVLEDNILEGWGVGAFIEEGAGL